MKPSCLKSMICTKILNIIVANMDCRWLAKRLEFVVSALNEKKETNFGHSGLKR